MNESLKLFDEFERTDTAPANYEESLFDALNRLSWNNAAEIRSTLEDWFSEYPEINKKDLQSRFRSKRDSSCAPEIQCDNTGSRMFLAWSLLPFVQMALFAIGILESKNRRKPTK